MMCVDDLRRLMMVKNKSLRNVRRRDLNSCKKTYDKSKNHLMDGSESSANSEATPRTNNTSGSTPHCSRISTSNHERMTVELKPIAERARPRAVASRRAKSFTHGSTISTSFLTQDDYSDAGSVVSKSERRASVDVDQWYFESSSKTNNITDTTTKSNSNKIITERHSSLSKYKFDEKYELYSRSRSLSPLKGSKFTASFTSRRIVSKRHSINIMQDDDGSICSISGDSVASFATTGRLYGSTRPRNSHKSFDRSDYSCDQSVRSCRTLDVSLGRSSSLERRSSMSRPRAVVLRDHSKKKLQGSVVVGDGNKRDNNKPPSQSPPCEDDKCSGISNLIQALRSQIISLHLNEGKNSSDAYNTCYIMLDQLEKSHTAAISDLSDQVKHWKNNAKVQKVSDEDTVHSTYKTVNDAFFSHAPTRQFNDVYKDDDDDSSFYSSNRSNVLETFFS